MARRGDPRRVAERTAAVDRMLEAQRVLDLAAKEGLFDGCYAATMNKVGRRNTKQRIREQAHALLADQYPELIVLVCDNGNRLIDIDGPRGLFQQRFKAVVEIKRRFQ